MARSLVASASVSALAPFPARPVLTPPHPPVPLLSPPTLAAARWEAYTAGRPYAGLAPADVARRVYSEGLRPHFPHAAPPDYVALAADCWQTDPAARPALPEVVARLEALHARAAAQCEP